MNRHGRWIGVSAMLFVLALVPSGLAHEEGPSSRQDKADLPATLDSWYKVTRGSEYIGYARERLARQTRGDGRWEYREEVEIEINTRLGPWVESRRVEARLDDTYAPLSLKQTHSRDGVVTISSVYAEDAGRRITVRVGESEPRRHPAAEDEVHYSRALLFFSLRQNESLSRPGLRRALLFHPAEADRPPRVEVQLDVQDTVRREYLGRKDVFATRVVYIKPPPAASREAELLESYVDKYGRVLEETTRGGLRRIIVRDRKEAMESEARVRVNGRRDPFLRPRYASELEDDPKAGERAAPIPDDIAQAIKDLQKQLEELKKAADEHREAEAEKHYGEIVRYYVALMKQHDHTPLAPQDLAQIQAFRPQAEQIWGGVARLMNRLRAIYLQIGRHFEREECAEMERGIEELRRAAEREPALQFTAEQTGVRQWVAELELDLTKCRIRMELMRKPLFLTGTVLHDKVEMIPVDSSVIAFGHTMGTPLEMRFVKPDHQAVINGRTCRVGDIVEGEGVRVERIWAHGIQVSLRGETRDIPIRLK